MKTFQVAEYTVVADTCSVSERIRGCLIETTEELPSDYLSLFKTNIMYWVGLDHVAKVISVYDNLDVPHGTLNLATPAFDDALPKLEAAVSYLNFVKIFLKNKIFNLLFFLGISTAFSRSRTTSFRALRFTGRILFRSIQAFSNC